MSAEAENYSAALKQYKSLWNKHGSLRFHPHTIKLQWLTGEIRVIKKRSQSKKTHDGRKPADRQFLRNDAKWETNCQTLFYLFLLPHKIAFYTQTQTSQTQSWLHPAAIFNLSVKTAVPLYLWEHSLEYHNLKMQYCIFYTFIYCRKLKAGPSFI